MRSENWFSELRSQLRQYRRNRKLALSKNPHHIFKAYYVLTRKCTKICKKIKKNFFVRKNQKFRELHDGVFRFSMRCLIIILCLNLCLYFKPAALAVWKVLVGNFIWFRCQAERTRNFKIQVVLWTSRTGTTPKINYKFTFSWVNFLNENLYKLLTLRWLCENCYMRTKMKVNELRIKKIWDNF